MWQVSDTDQLVVQWLEALEKTVLQLQEDYSAVICDFHRSSEPAGQNNDDTAIWISNCVHQQATAAVKGRFPMYNGSIK